MPKVRESYGPGGVLGELYGPYENRMHEYRFAVMTAFNRGIFRKDSPVLDVGCRNPYQGMLKFLREFGWDEEAAARWLDAPYVGVDCEFEPEVLAQAESDDRVFLIHADLDEVDLRPADAVKPFAVAFCIEVLEHLADPSRLVSHLQDAAATIFLIGPNAAFQGYYHDVPGHVSSFDADTLRAWGCQEVGWVNYNGAPKKGARNYPIDNGESETSSEVWGFWRDARAEAMVTAERTRREAAISQTMTTGDLLAMRGLLTHAGHRLVEVPSGRR